MIQWSILLPSEEWVGVDPGDRSRHHTTLHPSHQQVSRYTIILPSKWVDLTLTAFCPAGRPIVLNFRWVLINTHFTIHLNTLHPSFYIFYIYFTIVCKIIKLVYCLIPKTVLVVCNLNSLQWLEKKWYAFSLKTTMYTCFKSWRYFTHRQDIVVIH